MKTNREIITEAYAGFNRRDIDAVLALMHPDVDWPNGMEGGRVHGREEVRDYWRRQWGMIDPHVDPVGIDDHSGGDLMVTVHQVVRDLSGGLLGDQMVRHVYSIRDGLILRMMIEEAVNESSR